jgi:3-hydroxyisobutyrate dehydrogenase
MDRVARQRGWSFIDAAILSGVGQMYQGTATLLLGGSDDDIERARPVLEAISATLTRFGAIGSGMAAKVINNAVAHAVMVVLAEAGAMAVANGIDGAELTALLSGPEAGLNRPLTHRFAERILHGSYDGGMPTEAARKDSTLAIGLAQQARVPLFAIQAAHTVYELGVDSGLGRQDYSAIATLWEKWTGRSMKTIRVGSAQGGVSA